jgi:tetratricopeptide (TPR) repeat protein
VNVKFPIEVWCQRLGIRALRLSVIALLLLGCVIVGAPSAAAQLPHAKQPAQTPHKPVANQAETELVKRIADAQAARKSGDAAAVGLANQRLIALALRELGQLRLLESAYPQSVELYRRALDFEDQPATRVDLAIAEYQANRFDDAIAEATKAIQSDSKDVRAFSILGRALVKKQEYAKAAEAFDQAARLSPDTETLYSLAICLLQSKDAKDRERAAEVFAQMKRLDGDSGSLHVLFGRAYRDANDMPSAVREFERAVALDPRTPHAHYFLALARMAVNEWKATPEIKAEFSKELAHYPHDYLTNYMLGFIASSERQYDVSDRYLKAAVAVNPDWPEPWLYMGLNDYAQGDSKSAEAAFRKAITLTGTDESRSNFQIRRAYVDLGRILAASGHNEESAVYLAKARELQNKTLEAGQQDVSAIALAGGAGSAAAIVPLNRQSETEAAPVTPESSDPFARVDATVVARSNLTEQQRAAADSQEKRLRAVLGLGYNDLATSEAMRHEYVTAIGHYQEAERWDPAVDGLPKNLGMSAFRVNNYPEAIRGLSIALTEKPTDAPVRAMLGAAYFATEKYADAVATLSPLGIAGMQDSTVGYAWASSLVHLGELKKATDVLSEFEKANRSGEVLLLIGQLWIEIGDYSRAVGTFEAALQSEPALPKAHYYAGQAYIRWEHWPEAANEFQSELALQPNDADAKYNLGFVYLQQSKADDALKIFQEVVAAHPSHANAQYELGKILLDRGQLADAVDHLESAVRLSPGSDYMHYQLQAAYRKQSRLADADRELAVYKELKAGQRAASSTNPAAAGDPASNGKQQ